MTKRVIAAVAAIGLIVFDYWIIAMVFFMGGDGKPAIMAAIVIAGFGTAFALRRSWLIFVAQNVLGVLTLIRAAQYGERLTLGNIALVITVIVIGNVLAWLVARAIPDARSKPV